MSEGWTADHAPVEAYDRLKAQLARAEKLLGEIRTGKHSLPGTLVQIERYFEHRGQELGEPQKVPGEPF
jgi:hypothetical protein